MINQEEYGSYTKKIDQSKRVRSLHIQIDQSVRVGTASTHTNRSLNKNTAPTHTNRSISKSTTPTHTNRSINKNTAPMHTNRSHIHIEIDQRVRLLHIWYKSISSKSTAPKKFLQDPDPDPNLLSKSDTEARKIIPDPQHLLPLCRSQGRESGSGVGSRSGRTRNFFPDPYLESGPE
jgi:hypothetical protein